MKLIYVAGPYGAPTFNGISENIRRAESAAVVLWDLGFAAFCPHLNTAHFEVKANAPESAYKEMGLRMVAVCDAVLLIGAWRSSTGTIAEVERARAVGIPVFESLPDLVAALDRPNQ